MSGNFSSSNDSLHQPNISFIDPYSPLNFDCILNSPGSFVFITFSVTNILLLLPLCILILYLGLQQWRQQRSTSTAAMTNHSDSFTYHMVTMELVYVFGCILCCCGIYRTRVLIVFLGYCLVTFTWYGEMLFHSLTCVERYLAVVHPIIYLSLKRERGVRIRNISIGCVWLLCIGGASLMYLDIVSFILDICLCIFSLIITSYCSLSVLCVLIRPGPGEQGKDRQRVDQSKQRAFYTIVAIVGALMLRFSWDLAWVVVNLSGRSIECVMRVSGSWFNLPCSLVLPLLFLHRAGALACCKKDTK